MKREVRAIGVGARLRLSRLHLRATILVAAAVVLLVPGVAPGAEAQEGQPSTVIEAFHGDLLEVMKQAETLGYRGRYERLEPALQRTFDLDFMAEKALGRHWRTLDEADQERLRDIFHRFTLATYANRFSGYSGERFELVAEQPAPRDTVFVRTRLIRTDGEEPVEINYRMHRGEAGWRVIDVLLRGTVSELALRRSEYSSVIKRDGFEKLLATLEEKIADLATGKTDESLP